MKNVKLAFMVLVCILLVVLVIQNTAPVQAHFFWMTAELPVIVLLFAATLGGFILGVLITLLVKKETEENRKE